MRAAFGGRAKFRENFGRCDRPERNAPDGRHRLDLGGESSELCSHRTSHQRSWAILYSHSGAWDVFGESDAGRFFAAIQQHIQVSDQQTTLLEIVLGSVLSSFEKLRKQPAEQLASDEWIWVLRSSSATRSILRWQDGTVIVEGIPTQGEVAQSQSIHGRFDVTSGSDHPGSVSNLASSPATAFAYDVAVGEHGRLYVAGQLSYEGGSPAGGLVAEWVPSGKIGDGPVTSIVVRESELGAYGPIFRGIRMSHDNQLALTDRVSFRYGSDYVAAGLRESTMALRPRGEVAIQLSPSWQLAALAAMSTWQQTSDGTQAGLQSAMNSLDAFPTLLLRDGRPVFENNLHAEVSVEHALGTGSSISAAVFHDNSSHTAVFGRGPVSGPDYLQDYFSDVFAYDGGKTSSTGARAAFHHRWSDNLDATIVYDYAGVLAPDDDAFDSSLRDQLLTRYRQSLAARVSANVPHLGTKVSVGYKWIGGQAVTHLDPYGESLFHLDPYLNMEIRQQLPSFFPATWKPWPTSETSWLKDTSQSQLETGGWSLCLPTGISAEG